MNLLGDMIMHKKLVSCLVYCLIAALTTEWVFAGVNVTYSAYSAEIADSGQLQIRRGEAGQLAVPGDVFRFPEWREGVFRIPPGNEL